jgi:hypothetical protein
VRLLVCQSAYLSVSLSACQSVCLSALLLFCRSVSLSVSQSAYMSVRLSVIQFAYLSVSLIVCQSVCKSVRLSICQSVSLKYTWVCLSAYVSFSLCFFQSVFSAARLSAISTVVQRWGCRLQTHEGNFFIQVRTVVSTNLGHGLHQKVVFGYEQCLQDLLNKHALSIKRGPATKQTTHSTVTSEHHTVQSTLTIFFI